MYFYIMQTVNLTPTCMNSNWLEFCFDFRDLLIYPKNASFIVGSDVVCLGWMTHIENNAKFLEMSVKLKGFLRYSFKTFEILGKCTMNLS